MSCRSLTKKAHLEKSERGWSVCLDEVNNLSRHCFFASEGKLLVVQLIRNGFCFVFLLLFFWFCFVFYSLFCFFVVRNVILERMYLKNCKVILAFSLVIKMFEEKSGHLKRYYIGTLS